MWRSVLASVANRPLEQTKCKKTNGSAYTALANGKTARKGWKTKGQGNKKEQWSKMELSLHGAWSGSKGNQQGVVTGKLESCKQWLGRKLKSGLGLLGAARLTQQASAAADEGPCVTTDVSGMRPQGQIDIFKCDRAPVGRGRGTQSMQKGRRKLESGRRRRWPRQEWSRG
jgi:hypothetical protein